VRLIICITSVETVHLKQKELLKQALA